MPPLRGPRPSRARHTDDCSASSGRSAIYWLNPAYLWWLLPIIGALILSIPLSVFTSRASLGQSFRKARLFLIPEESWPPLEIRMTRQIPEAGHAAAGLRRSRRRPGRQCSGVPQGGRARDKRRRRARNGWSSCKRRYERPRSLNGPGTSAPTRRPDGAVLASLRSLGSRKSAPGLGRCESGPLP